MERSLLRFENKNIIITGAASGIGKAAAKRIAQEGGNIGLIDIDEVGLTSTVSELSKLGTTIHYEICDVADFDAVKKSIDSLVDEFGMINGLSHNAGILRCYNTHEMTSDQWNSIIQINLNGTFNVTRHALPHLLKNKTSYLVHTSSIASYYRHPWLAAYSATKGAIKSFTRSLFIEYCFQGLHANCVLPGSIDTPLTHKFEIPEGADPTLIKALTPFGGATFIPPSDVAGAIAFLLSDDALFINGTEISVDGGKL